MRNGGGVQMTKSLRKYVIIPLFLAMIATPIKGLAEEMDPQDAATTVIVATEAGRQMYEGSIISRMAGRAGAMSPTGGKGIALEVMYTDKKQLGNLFKKGTKTRFTKSSIAPQADLVTTNARGCIIERIQLKDTPKSAAKTLEKVKTGQYRFAELVGTTESVNAYNPLAEKAGVGKKMTDSGISTKTTHRIAEKAQGRLPSPRSVANLAGRAALLGAFVEGGLATIHSVGNGDSIPTAVGNISYSIAKGATGSAGAAIVGDCFVAGRLV